MVVPSTPALLPEYAGLEDPLPELRQACREAVARLVEDHPDEVVVVAAPARPEAPADREPAGVRVGRQLLAGAGFTGRVQVVIGSDEPAQLAADVDGVLVAANGSAARGEKAPGHLDDRSFAFDEAIGTALDMGDAAVLRALDDTLGRQLWCHDVPALRALGRLAAGRVSARMTWAGDPYGVQYWVVRWTCGS